MPANARVSISDIEALKAQGWTQSQIAQHYGVTRQYISWIKHNYNGKLTPREAANREFPWKVPTELTHTSPYHRLRDHAEYMATGGIGMSEDKLKRLRTFYNNLHVDDVVVEFSPDIRPIEGVSNKGGWAFRKRKPSDGDLIIRVNKHTTLSDAGHMIWRFPPREP